MAHFVVFIAKKSTRFRVEVLVREYWSTKFATRGRSIEEPTRCSTKDSQAMIS